MNLSRTSTPTATLSAKLSRLKKRRLQK
jgi:hypothetical protein